jgi:hypothetical protein
VSLGEGSSFAAALRGEGAPPPTPVYCESIKSRVAYSGSALFALRTGDTKYIWAPRPEVYALDRDPGETVNRAGRDRSPPEDLRRMMEAIAAGGDVLAERAVHDEHTLEALRSLGYLTSSSAAPARSSPASELELSGFDPKDLVDVAMAGRDVQNTFYERAEVKLRRFLETVAPPTERPETSPLWSLARQNLAVIEMARGNFAEAAREYRKALRHEPRNQDARAGLVFALNLGGRAGEALAEADRLLGETPEAWRLRLHRALALALLERDGEAVAELREIAARGVEPELTRVADLYAKKIGTAEGAAYLELYLRSHSASR